MGRVKELITDHFVKRVAMYVGVREFREVGFWLSGFDYANRIAFPDEVSDLLGFKEWLLVRIGGDCVSCWAGIISENYGHGIEATDRFFELFKEFQMDIDARGLKSLLKEHYDFEVESYGAPRVSKYYSSGWDRR